MVGKDMHSILRDGDVISFGAIPWSAGVSNYRRCYPSRSSTLSLNAVSCRLFIPGPDA